MKTAGRILAAVALLLLVQGANAAFLPIPGGQDYFAVAHERSVALGWSVSLLDTAAIGAGGAIRWVDLLPSNEWTAAGSGRPYPGIAGMRPESMTTDVSFCDDSYRDGGCDLDLRALISYVELYLQRTQPTRVQLRGSASHS